MRDKFYWTDIKSITLKFAQFCLCWLGEFDHWVYRFLTSSKKISRWCKCRCIFFTYAFRWSITSTFIEVKHILVRVFLSTTYCTKNRSDLYFSDTPNLGFLHHIRGEKRVPAKSKFYDVPYNILRLSYLIWKVSCAAATMKMKRTNVLCINIYVERYASTSRPHEQVKVFLRVIANVRIFLGKPGEKWNKNGASSPGRRISTVYSWKFQGFLSTQLATLFFFFFRGCS